MFDVEVGGAGDGVGFLVDAAEVLAGVLVDAAFELPGGAQEAGVVGAVNGEAEAVVEEVFAVGPLGAEAEGEDFGVGGEVLEAGGGFDDEPLAGMGGGAVAVEIDVAVALEEVPGAEVVEFDASSAAFHADLAAVTPDEAGVEEGPLPRGELDIWVWVGHVCLC